MCISLTVCLSYLSWDYFFCLDIDKTCSSSSISLIFCKSRVFLFILEDEAFYEDDKKDYNAWDITLSLLWELALFPVKLKLFVVSLGLMND